MEKVRQPWELWIGLLFLIGMFVMVGLYAFELWELSRYGQVVRT
jgi:hypothetical protein